jgi:lysophospholipase L1-like esterase
MSATAASGGTAPLTYQWYRSTTANFTPGAGNLLAGATSLTLADSASLTADTPYYYVCRATDGASQTADSNQVAGVLKAAPLNLGFIGDSITAGYGLSAGQDPATQIVPILRKLYKDRTITATNKAVSGSKTSQWVTGQTNLTSAKTDFASAGVTHVHIMLGANDAASSNLVPAATYKSNLQNIIADLNGAGYKVILSYPTFIPAGANSGATTTASVALARSYMAQIDSLIDNVNVLRGDVWAYNYFIGNLSEYQSDMTHPTAAGAISLATIWARAIEMNVLASPAAATTSRTVTLTLGDTTGPLANLAGIKVAAFDQPTPDLRAAPQYKSSSQTTDASGVLTFAMQSTLPSGGTCGVSVQLADGRNFDVSATVT